MTVKRFSFTFLADCQLGCYATFSGMTETEVADYAARGLTVRIAPRVEGFEWDARRYQAAIHTANRQRPAFVIIGGDMVDDPFDDGQYEEFLRITRTLDPSIPIHWAPGNHDLGEKALVPTWDTLERYRSLFGTDYYTFAHDGARLFILNTVTLDQPDKVPEEAEAQIAFLEEQLEMAYDRGEAPLLLFGHHPLFIEHPDEEDTYWNISGRYRRLLLDLVRRFGVTAAFAGHLHRNAIANDGEFEMVTSGPVGYPLGDDPSGYRIVDVYPDHIEHSYHRLELGP